MTNKLRAVILISVGLALVGTVRAECYKATVTREAQNLYRVEYSHPRVYVKTRYCYVYCYYEAAIIDTTVREIHFLDSDATCDIDEILVER